MEETAESFEWLDVVDAREHSEADDVWEASEVVDEATTTDKRLEGRPKIRTESNK